MPDQALAAVEWNSADKSSHGAQTTILQVAGISKRFGNIPVISDLNLTLRQGEVLSLLGPSGCGKTTTLRIIAGLEAPDSGEISLKDKTVVSVRDRLFVPIHKRNLGMVFQSYAIWPHMTVYENVRYPLKVRGTRGERARRKILDSLQIVGLYDFAERSATELSGGQQQRVALARALVHEPDLLLLDEPFSNLDAKLREQTRVQLKLLLSRLQISAIFVTHDQEEALGLSSRIAVMNQGRIEQIGTPQELYDKPETEFVRDFLGRTLVLRGIVEGSPRPDLLSVRVSEIERPLTVLKPAWPAASGDVVSLSVRPEELTVRAFNPDHASANTGIGRIEAALFAGDHYECQIRLGSAVILLPLSRSLHRQARGTVAISFPEKVAVWRA